MNAHHTSSFISGAPRQHQSEIFSLVSDIIKKMLWRVDESTQYHSSSSSFPTDEIWQEKKKATTTKIKGLPEQGESELEGKLG